MTTTPWQVVSVNLDQHRCDREDSESVCRRLRTRASKWRSPRERDNLMEPAWLRARRGSNSEAEDGAPLGSPCEITV